MTPSSPARSPSAGAVPRPSPRSTPCSRRRHRRAARVHPARRARRAGHRRPRRRRARRLREAGGPLARPARRDDGCRGAQRPPPRGRLPAAHRLGRGPRSRPPRLGRARTPARRDVPDAVVPRPRLLRGAVARQVGDRGRRPHARPRHPPDRPARLAPRRLGERAGPALAPRPRDPDGGRLDGGHRVRRRRRGIRHHQRPVAARDELDPHRHRARDGHGRPPLRARARALAHHAGAARRRRDGGGLGAARGGGGERARPARARHLRGAAGRARRCRRPRSDAARSFEIVTAIYSSAASGAVVTPETLRDDVDRRRSLESPVTDLRRG